ncbi:DUF924-domain-containing protein [Aaosphaeria arxii CBS 175.79]|uniref:DUF924-domain-containing protein n=1 Tax=Aaosphaeria arxii CBS 175.79 TaxID=1450172 RepID=A0A6A5XAJ8_9PLEO|nr:DUF924-domain-containing protein [Aaosphaeria arxii CBS 175.79]KAF2009807.1 DUF924-domain-containing protein [Aaosphaeria arxii CBS 175.79]
MGSFTLDRTIFNSELYDRVRDIWFEGHPLDAKEVSIPVLRRWFMGTPEEKVEFDSICRENFKHALEVIGPEKFPSPTAEPFLRQIEEVVQNDTTPDGSKAAWTTLSMVLLLDQMTRNIFRDKSGLAKVYSHYDQIAYSLILHLLSSDSPIQRPDLHPQWRVSVAHRQWFFLPLIHSENIEAHNKASEIMAKLKEDIESEGVERQSQFLEQGLKAEREHREILDRFGRYPHRNLALGRKSTAEEERFLAEGGATFGVAQAKK